MGRLELGDQLARGAGGQDRAAALLRDSSHQVRSRGTIELLFGETADVESDLVGRWRGGAVPADDPCPVAPSASGPKSTRKVPGSSPEATGVNRLRDPGVSPSRSILGRSETVASWRSRSVAVAGSLVPKTILSDAEGHRTPGRQARARGQPADQAVPERAVEVALFALLRRQERPAPHARALDDDGTARSIRLIG